MRNIKSQLFKILLFSFIVALVAGCGETTDEEGDGSGGNGQQQEQGSGNGESSGGGQEQSSGNNFNVDVTSINLNSCVELDATIYKVNTTLNSGCYVVKGKLEVAENKLLTIEPGTAMVFKSGGFINVKGALKAIGTPIKPILFSGTTQTAGHWRGIQFDNAVDDRNELANIIIEYAGSWYYGALYATGSTKLKIRDSIIRNNELNGFYFDNDVALNEFQNITSTKNAERAGVVGVNALSALDGTSDFTGNNGDDYVVVNSGTIAKDQTWNALNVPVLSVGQIIVPQNKLLTINPGAKFDFTSNGFISVNGALKAVGTGATKNGTTTTKDENPIIFSGSTKAAGQWRGIQFDNAVDDRNELAHIVIEYAGSWYYGALYATGATKLKIRDSIIRNNSLEGFYFDDDVVLNEFSNVTSTNNEKTAGLVGAKALSAIDSTSNFVGNIGGDYLSVSGDTLTTDQTWNALSVPALVLGQIVVSENKLLTIKPGAKFDFSPNGFLSVNGALKAVGTTTEKIVFSGATKSTGFWRGISFNNAVDTRNELSNIVMEYAGSWYYGAIYANGSTVLNVHDSVIQNNDLFGIWIGDSATVTNTNNTFINNADGDVHQD